MNARQEARHARCLQFLAPIAHPIEDSVDHVHWLDARNFDADQGPSYCQKCGEAEAEKANEANPEHDYFLAGGYGYESDGQEFCEVCGDFLNTYLTNYGVNSELEHFESTRLSLKGRCASSTAYALSRVLECADLQDPVKGGFYTHDYQIKQIRSIQRGVHKLTRRIEAIAKRAAHKSKDGAS